MKYQIIYVTQLIYGVELEHGFHHLRDGNCKTTQMEMNQFPVHVNIRKVKRSENYHLKSVDKLF